MNYLEHTLQSPLTTQSQTHPYLPTMISLPLLILRYVSLDKLELHFPEFFLALNLGTVL